MKARLILVVAAVMGVALLASSAAAEEPGVIATVPVGVKPQGVAVNANTNLIYVANRDGQSVSVIYGGTNTVIDTITGVGYPSAVAANPITNLIYVADQGGNKLRAIDGDPAHLDTTYHTVVDEIGVGAVPYGADVNPDTNRVYVANYGAGSGTTVSVIDGTLPLNSLGTVTVGSGPLGVAVNSATNRIYVANRASNTVSVIAGVAPFNVVATIGVGSSPYGVSADPTTNLIYVANENSHDVSVIDGDTYQVVGDPIPVGSGPEGVAVNPTTNRIYVANHNSENVSVIEGGAVVATVPVGAWTHGVAANPVTNRIYVTNHWGDTVSVILWCVFDDDADCDACYDIREPGLPTAADDTDPWDFYDVPVQPLYIGGHISGDPSLLDSRDHAISIINDVLAVLEYSGTSDEGPPNGLGIDYDDDVNGDGIDDGIPYDRSVGATRSAIPNRAVSIIVDVLLVLEQSGQSCPPP